MGAAALLSAKAPAPQIAITIDDFGWRQIPQPDARKTNRAFLDALARHSNLKATIFVCGKNVDDADSRPLLQEWSDAGHTIGNHTYSHLNYNSPSVSVETFSSDVLRGEAIISGFAGFGKWFRFPYLKEGSIVAKRDQMRAFLAEHGYRNGHVTIDTSDWYYDQRLKARLKQNPLAEKLPYRDAYLAHIWDRATYYDGLAEKLLGHSIPHTILLHYTLINSLFLDDLLGMFESRGWHPVSAQIAYNDRLFSRNPEILPAGESLIWALAKASKSLAVSLRYPGESDEYEKDKLDRLGL